MCCTQPGSDDEEQQQQADTLPHGYESHNGHASQKIKASTGQRGGPGRGNGASHTFIDDATVEEELAYKQEIIDHLQETNEVGQHHTNLHALPDDSYRNVVEMNVLV